MPFFSHNKTAPHSLEHCQAAVLPQRRRKRSRARVADAVAEKTAAANATDEEIKKKVKALRRLRKNTGRRDMTRAFAEQ